VGQGDALALRAGPASAVVVDAGPDPRAVQRCLDSLGVRHVPLLILTHFHADHVTGVPGVLDGRTVDHALVSPLPDPELNAADVAAWLHAAEVPTTVATAGLRWRVGSSLDLEVVWPARLIASDESAANNASVAVLADVGGIRALLTGDLEPTAQAAMLRALPSRDVDVIKVAHHGSAHQDPRVGAGLGADLALISVGDNDYGHPSERVVDALRAAGVTVRRTDQHGSIAVVDTGDRVGVVTGGPQVAEPD
jgi:competence protein ComEC